MPNSTRIFKVADLIKREISKLLLFEVKDPRIKMITISDVKLSNDLAYAKIFFMTSEDTNVKEIAGVLNKASSFLRSKLGEKTSLRLTPELSFHYDDSLAKSLRIKNLLDDALKDVDSEQ